MKSERPQIQRTDGLCREAERRALTAVPTSTWYELQSRGLAPKPVKLGPRSVAWSRQELLAWCERRLTERDGASEMIHAPPP